MRWIREIFGKISGRLSVIGRLFKYLWANKMWWLIPMVAILAVGGVILMLAHTTPLGVFIYTIF